MLHLQGGRGAEAGDGANGSRSNAQSGVARPRHYNLGLALVMQRSWPKQRRNFRRRCVFRPTTPRRTTTLAPSFIAAGRLDDAARHYRLAASLRPDNGGQNNLGRVLTQQGRQEEASSTSIGRWRSTRFRHGPGGSRLGARDVGRIATGSRGGRPPGRARRSLTGHQDPAVLDAWRPPMRPPAHSIERWRQRNRPARRRMPHGSRTSPAEIEERLRLYRRQQPYLARP